MYLNRRVRSSSLLKDLNEFQIEYYKTRDEKTPLGTEWYSTQQYPSDSGEWDVDSYLLAECETREVLLAFQEVHLGKSTPVSFAQVISMA